MKRGEFKAEISTTSFWSVLKFMLKTWWKIRIEIVWRPRPALEQSRSRYSSECL